MVPFYGISAPLGKAIEDVEPVRVPFGRSRDSRPALHPAINLPLLNGYSATIWEKEKEHALRAKYFPRKVAPSFDAELLDHRWNLGN